MAELEKMLDPAKFIRVHRSSIINLERIARIELYDERQPHGDY